MTGAHSDLYSVAVTVAFLGLSASFRLMFFARLISCQILSYKRKFFSFHSIWISCYELELFLFKLMRTSLRKPQFLTPRCRKAVSFEILDKIVHILTIVRSTLLFLIFWTDIPDYEHRDRNKRRIDNHHDVRRTEEKQLELNLIVLCKEHASFKTLYPNTVRILVFSFSSPVRINFSNLSWTSYQLANQCPCTNGFYGYDALGPGLWRDPTRHDDLKWHIFDRASTACTLKARRTRFPRMPRHAKSKLQLIFPAKWLSEMESASSKTGEGV